MVQYPVGLPDVLCLVGILVLALVTRLPGIALRGQWDADQGNELLVMLHWVRDGLVPLVGPSTFAGTFHHGALYYYLLARRRSSRTWTHAIVLTISLLGLATGRRSGPSGTRSVAGGRPTWRACSRPCRLRSSSARRSSGTPTRCRSEPRWQSWGRARLDQVLGPLVAARGPRVHGRDAAARQRRAPRAAAPARVGPRPGPPAQRRARPGARGGARRRRDHRGRVPATLRPRAGHRVRRHPGAGLYLRGGAGVGASGDLATRMFVVAFRSLAWPFTGVITEAPMASAAVTVAFLVLLALAFRGGGNRARPALLLFTGILLWSPARAGPHCADPPRAPWRASPTTTTTRTSTRS